MKRKSRGNRALLPPKSEDADLINRKQEQADHDKMKMFVQLRQDLERVRIYVLIISKYYLINYFIFIYF